ANVSLAGLAAGAYAGGVAASFAGDANHAPSGGANALAVSRAGTVTNPASGGTPFAQIPTVALQGPGEPIAPGAGTATGTITVRDGTQVLAVINLASGVATLSTSSLTVGTHVITVGYSGDANFTGSSSPATTVIVKKTSKKGVVSSLAKPN